MRILTLIITSLGLLLVPASALAQAPPFTLFPVVGGAEYTNDYGDPRGGGSHEGNDLLAPCGTPAIAVVAGTVRLDYGSRSGWMVTLTGKSSWYRYIHMGIAGDAASAFAKGLRNGSRVKEGQVISYVGRTGDAAGAPCHLHFELHYGARVVSPYDLLQQATIVQPNAADPAMSTAANQVSLSIAGRIAWAGIAGDQGRIVMRATSITPSSGEAIGRTGLIVLRATPELVSTVKAGSTATVTTAPSLITSELLAMKPLSWTAATVS